MVPADDPVRPGVDVDARSTAGAPSFRWKRRLAGIGAGLAAFAFFRFLTARPELAEQVAGSGVLPAIGRSMSLASGAIPFSLAEVVVFAVIGRQVWGLVLGVRQVRGGEDRLARTALRGGMRVSQDAGVLFCAFVLLWGLQYARPGLESRLGIDPAGEVTVNELETLALGAVEASNRLYFAVHGTHDTGSPTRPPPRHAVIPELEQSWERVARQLDLPARAARPHGAPKRFLAGKTLRRFGVAGMYFPFTGEALVLGDLPGASLPRDLGHEMAHQRGFAYESDANVLGFLVAREAADPRINYSAYVFLQRQLIAALAVRDPGAAFEVIRARAPGVQRDVETYEGYWREARGWSRRVTRVLNHAMLRAHGVPGGIANYAGSTWVFAALARERGIQAVLPVADEPDPTPAAEVDD